LRLTQFIAFRHDEVEAKPRVTYKSECRFNLDLSPRRTLLVQIATQLASSQIAALGKASPLDHSSYDELFAAALRRADRLITSPHEDTSLIYAEQLFPATKEIITEGQIGEIFNKWRWPGLSSRQSFLGLMADVAKWFEERLEKLQVTMSSEFGATGLQEERFLTALFRFCKGVGGHPLNGPWPPEIDDLAGRITNFVEEFAQARTSPQSVRAVRIRELMSEREHVLICFADRTPVDRSTEPKNMPRSYRPWGLFRYLRFVGASDPSAERLLQKLCVPRSLLSPEFEPEALVHSDNRFAYDLGVLEELADEYLSESDDERRERLKRRNRHSSQPSGS
jgi:hypothetical protein